jgi:hypothetical protein
MKLSLHRSAARSLLVSLMFSAPLGMPWVKRIQISGSPQRSSPTVRSEGHGQCASVALNTLQQA